MTAPHAGSGDGMDGLTPGLPAVQVMSEYVRAVRLLGHSGPEPTRLHTAYTAEDGLDLQALDADARALSAAAATAEETLQLQEQARRTLDDAWRGAGAQAAADQLRRNNQAAGTVAEGLRVTARALDDLRNRLRQLVDTKVDRTLEVEGRGLRAEWQAAARTVTTGAGDRSAASELVDLQVAPFVAHDIGVDWVTSMRDCEAAIRQAYRDAEAAAGAAAAVFDPPTAFRAHDAELPATERVWAVPAGSAPATVPAAYHPAPTAPEPVAATATPVPPPTPAAAGPAEMPAPTPGGLGGMASPMGSGMSGLSGLGQSIADMLGGLLGAGGEGRGDNLGGAEDSGIGTEPDELEIDDPVTDEELEDEERSDDESKDGESDYEEADDEPVDEPGDAPAAPGDRAPIEPIEPVVPQPEPVPTPVPDPPVDPISAPESVPPETPCQIAADELPQAGP